MAACAILLLTACDGGDESLDPELRAPDTGTYAYEAIVLTDEAVDAEPDTFVGSLQIDVSSEDSITGTWSVPGYGGQARGVWNIVAYVLAADPSPPIQGTITHRVWRANNTGNLACNVTYQYIQMPADTFTTSTENSCSLVRSGN
ncbi:MAG TPA: hypothetical protein VF039_06215 [Longimicrobiales bacterium]